LKRLSYKDFENKVYEYLSEQVEVKSLAGLAVFLLMDKQQLLELSNKSEKFAQIISYAITFMEKEIVENGLRGKYNATMASFMLKTVFGYKEKKDEPSEFGSDIKIELADELKRYAT
jgi:ABC-type transport system substrate-binding protein